jgi:hypothetical protein
LNDTIAIIILILLLGLGWLVLPQFFVSRAIVQVIRILRKHNALDLKNAKSVVELGLKPKSLLESMGRFRDYKPGALQVLIGAKIVKTTDDGRVYLSESNLSASRWKNA